ncbi:rhodanese-like domain-containing protein [Desulfococcus sp.]|uniref:rhodanese-like domain-containing protein n=1 Tax=Desulfococcus sp. TaxID=2025834 RepID=UPI0035941967
MKKKCLVMLGTLLVLLGLISVAVAETAPPKDLKKHTKAGKYVTSLEAYEMWKINPDKVKILDCRIQEEYAYVGHANMAHSIPSRLWVGKWNEEKKDYDLQDNPTFEAQVKRKFSQSDTILVMCRSGHRSASSVDRLTKVGFTNVYNIIDGFEGDKIKDEESYLNGKRMKNGWKNSGAPWTYDLDSKLIYTNLTYKLAAP